MKLKDIFLKLNNIGELEIATDDGYKHLDTSKEGIKLEYFDYEVIMIAPYIAVDVPKLLVRIKP